MAKEKIIFVGSGLGTLVSATILSRHGYDVLVLEKNKQLGGNLQVFSRDKTVFDTGVHYIGGLKKGQNLYQYFDYLNIMKDLAYESMDTLFEQVYLSPDTKNGIGIGQGKANFIASLSDSYPEEAAQIESYFGYLEQTCEAFPMYQVRLSVTEPKPAYFDESVDQVLNRFFKSDDLKKVLWAPSLIYGDNPTVTPWYIHALISYSYIQGAFKLKNGASQIIKLLSKQIRANGGQLLKEKEIIQTELEGTKLKNVICSDGSNYTADHFIFNIHPKQMLRFLPQAFKKIHLKRILDSPETTSSFSVYISLKKGVLPYINHNQWIYYGKNGSDKMMVSFIPDPQHEGYASGINILSFDHIKPYEAWKDSFHTTSKLKSRGEGYLSFKNQKEQELIQILKVHQPETMQAIDHIYSASPLSYRDYIDGVDGSMYGMLKHIDLTKSIRLDSKTKLKNVFLVGQNVSLHGILGVCIGAVKTCFHFIPAEQLMKDIQNVGNEEE